jgi:YHS domain-containing protein
MAPTKILDPVCGMVVDVDEARDAGLTLERPEREYAFCAAGCLTSFAKEPQRYIPKVEAWLAAGAAEPEHDHHDAMPALDNGMREWYKSCRCCMSEAYPKLVEQLDAEKAQAAGH